MDWDCLKLRLAQGPAHQQFFLLHRLNGVRDFTDGFIHILEEGVARRIRVNVAAEAVTANKQQAEGASQNHGGLAGLALMAEAAREHDFHVAFKGIGLKLYQKLLNLGGFCVVSVKKLLFPLKILRRKRFPFLSALKHLFCNCLLYTSPSPRD